MDYPRVETYNVGAEVQVVRDDATSLFPGPNNSKVRGVYRVVERLRSEGVRAVATLDTAISRIGWAVAQVCFEEGLEHLAFYPKIGRKRFYQEMTEAWTSTIVPIQGTFSSAMAELRRRWLEEHKVKAFCFPTGLTTEESVQSNADALLSIPRELTSGSLVVCVSSGTICAGLLRGMEQSEAKGKVFGITSSSFTNRAGKIRKLARSNFPLTIVDLGYQYRERIEEAPPFPCDVFLDRKAWAFVTKYARSLPQPVVFWNVGGEWDPEKGLAGLRGDGVVTQGDIDGFLQNRLERIR